MIAYQSFGLDKKRTKRLLRSFFGRGRRTYNSARDARFVASFPRRLKPPFAKQIGKRCAHRRFCGSGLFEQKDLVSSRHRKAEGYFGFATLLGQRGSDNTQCCHSLPRSFKPFYLYPCQKEKGVQGTPTIKQVGVPWHFC